LSSIYEYTPEELNFEVVVVDNASTDDTVRMVNDNFPQAKFIGLDKRTDYFECRRIGLNECRGAYLVLANVDTYIKSDVYYQMRKFLKEHPEAAGCAPGLFYPDGKPQTGAAGSLPGVASFLKYFLFLSRNGFYLRRPEGKKEIAAGWISGAAPMYRREILTELLDKKNEIFYFEDVEFGKRLRAREKKIYYLPYLKVYHHQGIIADQSRFITDFNQYLKRHNPVSRRIMLLIAAIGFFIRGFRKKVLFKWTAECLKKLP